jgi:xylulokinase
VERAGARLWWDGTVAAVRAVLASTGTSGADVAGDRADRPDARRRPARFGPATCSGRPSCGTTSGPAPSATLIRRAVGPERLIAITGNDALTGFTAPKLVWVRDHEPDVWDRIAHVLLPKDYVRLRLTGDYAVDKADGSGTLLFDLAARDWSSEVLGALAIDPAWMPPTFEGPEITGLVSAGRPPLTGLRPARRSWPAAATRRPTRWASAPWCPAGWPCRWAPRAWSSRPRSGRSSSRRPRPRLLPRRPGTLAHDVGDALGGGQPALVPRRRGARRGVRRPGRPAAEVPAGAAGSGSCRTSAGERSPHPDPLARGAFVGLTLAHDRRHLTRAVLEGVAFGLRDGLDLMVAAGMPAPTQIRASGGGTASPLWRQILADVLDAEIATVNTTEGAAYGAGLLAAVGAGWYPSVEAAAAALVTATPVAAPGPDAPRYAEAHAIYRDLYPALAPSFHRM